MEARSMIDCICCGRCGKWATATGGGICEACVVRETRDAERDALRAELAEAKERGDGLYLGLRRTLEALGGVAQPGVSEAFLILGVPGEAAVIKRLNSALAADNARLRAALECVPVDLIHAIENGDTGANVFLSTGSCKLIGDALAATPAQSLAAHDAATKEPSPFLSRAAWRVVKEIWIDVAAGRMNARSAVADAALDLRGLLEESGPEPADDAVGVERKAETTFGGYLAAHDAALLREVAEKWEKRGDDCLKRASVNLRATADRIEKEAL